MFVQAGSLRLWVQDEGQGPAVLLLHGFPDSHELWCEQVKALAAAGYRVICPDMPGYGRSDKPTLVSAYGLKPVCAALAAMLDALGVRTAAVVGHDWGAATAWRFAYAYPDRVTRLAVLSTGHPGAGTSAGGARQRARWWYLFFFQYDVAETCLAADDWALMREFLGSEPPDVVRDYLRALSQPGALTAALNWYRANFRPELLGQTRPRSLPALALPVMGVWSDGDPALLEAQMTASAQYVTPGSWRYERIGGGVGHWMPRAAPQQVNRLLLDFLGAPPGRVGCSADESSGGSGRGHGSGDTNERRPRPRL